MSYDFFISHASEDRNIADELYNEFQKIQISCWYDNCEIGIGDPITQKINEGLKESKYGIVLISRNSIHRNWVLAEIGAFLNLEISGGKTRLIPLLIDDDQTIENIMKNQIPLMADKKFLKWSDGLETIVNSFVAKLIEEPDNDNTTKEIRKRYIKDQFGAVIFAAGKSERFKIEDNKTLHKMLIDVPQNSIVKPMLFHVIDLFKENGIEPLVLIGYNGSEIKEKMEEYYGYSIPKILRVSSDDACSEPVLPASTGETLKKYKQEIMNKLDKKYLLFAVGDQPFMRFETIFNFIQSLMEQGYKSGVIAADSRNTDIANSSATRINFLSEHSIKFETPPKDADYKKLSTLLDVGVISIERELFNQSIKNINEKDVFSKLLENLPQNSKFLLYTEKDVLQFKNINTVYDWNKILLESLNNNKRINVGNNIKAQNIQEDILFQWLKWNVDEKRNGNFEISRYTDQYDLVCEIDTTTICSRPAGCSVDCTYRNQHMNGIILDAQLGKNILDKAKVFGFKGVLFSGGGENLINEAYGTFLEVLKHAHKIGLHTNLATNGLFVDDDKIHNLVRYLNSIRFSIPSNKGDYCHAGIIAPKIVAFKDYVERNKDRLKNPTKIYVNILMDPEMSQDELEALIRTYSQMGVNGIRLKPKHENNIDNNGEFKININKYKSHLKIIKQLVEDLSLKKPEIMISKIVSLLILTGELQETEINDIPTTIIDTTVDLSLSKSQPSVNPKYCWYRDFNPLVLGADSHIYSCCELKYQAGHFDLGQVDSSGDNLINLISLNKAQKISEKCFVGCKGYLLNIYLQKLLNEYESKKERIFDFKENIDIKEKILENISRTVLKN